MARQFQAVASLSKSGLSICRPTSPPTLLLTAIVFAMNRDLPQFALAAVITQD